MTSPSDEHHEEPSDEETAGTENTGAERNDEDSHNPNSPTQPSTEGDPYTGLPNATRNLSEEKWNDLRAPFSRSNVRLTDIQTDSKNGRGLARPIISEDALIRRLTDVLGPEGWSLEFTLEGTDTYRCRLYIGSAFRDGIAQGAEPVEACLEALRMAIRTFEIGVGLHGPPNIYVEKDSDGTVTNFDEIIDDLREVGAVD